MDYVFYRELSILLYRLKFERWFDHNNQDIAGNWKYLCQTSSLDDVHLELDKELNKS